MNLADYFSSFDIAGMDMDYLESVFKFSNKNGDTLQVCSPGTMVITRRDDKAPAHKSKKYLPCALKYFTADEHKKSKKAPASSYVECMKAQKLLFGKADQFSPCDCRSCFLECIKRSKAREMFRRS